MTLSLTSPPAFPTCWCTLTWPCGPVQLKGHSCLTTALQCSLQKHCPKAQTQFYRGTMSHVLSTTPLSPRNLHIHHRRCWLNQCCLHCQKSLHLYICQFRPCSQHWPHRPTCTVKHRNHLQILSGTENQFNLKCTHCHILRHKMMNHCELDPSQMDPAQTAALP